MLFFGQGDSLLDVILDARNAREVRIITSVTKVHSKFCITFLGREGYGSSVSGSVIDCRVSFVGTVTTFIKIDPIRVDASVNTVFLEQATFISGEEA